MSSLRAGAKIYDTLPGAATLTGVRMAEAQRWSQSMSLPTGIFNHGTVWELVAVVLRVADVVDPREEIGRFLIDGEQPTRKVYEDMGDALRGDIRFELRTTINFAVEVCSARFAVAALNLGAYPISWLTFGGKLQVFSTRFAVATENATSDELAAVKASVKARADPQVQGFFLQELIKRYRYRRYLEIGCWKHETFNWLSVESKMCVDPFNAANTHNNAKETSDDFFSGSRVLPQYDLVFVDGDHRWLQVGWDVMRTCNKQPTAADRRHAAWLQVLRDVVHSLERLAPGGLIVLHDTVTISYPLAGGAARYHNLPSRSIVP
jgi:hypothetical protein